MKKKLIALLLVLTMLLMTGCESRRITFFDENTEIGSVDNKLEFNPDLGTTMFEDMVYEHYDATKVKSMISDLTQKITDAAYADQMLEDFKAIEDEIETLSLSYELAELESYRDSSNSYYQEEYKYVNEIYQDVFDLYCILGRAILDSPCGDTARKNWKESDIEEFEKYEPMTDEQKALKKEETALIAKYREESVKPFTYNIAGKDYEIGDLADAYYAGELTYDQYYEAYYGCMDVQAAALSDIYVGLVKVRQKIATAYGYSDYSSYAYEKTYDRDYTVQDAEAFCSEVKAKFVPAYANFLMSEQLYDTTSLNDVAASYTEEQKLDLVQKYLSDVDPILETYFKYMRQYHLCDIETRENKFDAGFTLFLNKYNQPFFYTNPSGTFYDIMTDVHEFGHFDSYCINFSKEGMFQNLDLAEIHSQGLEMLYTNYYGDMLGAEYKDAAERYTVSQRTGSIIEGCLYDEFQRRVYKLDNPTIEEINMIYGETQSEYYPQYYPIAEPSTYWMFVSHNFESPLYYISYAVSVVPALEIWHTSKSDFRAAADTYMKVVRAGEENGYKETLKAVGLKTPFEAGTIEEIASWLE